MKHFLLVALTLISPYVTAAWDQVRGGAVITTPPVYSLSGKELRIAALTSSVNCRDVTENDSAYFMGACGTGDNDDDNFRSSQAGINLYNIPSAWTVANTETYRLAVRQVSDANFIADVGEVRCDGGSHSCTKSVSLPSGILRFTSTQANGKYFTSNMIFTQGMANHNGSNSPSYTTYAAFSSSIASSGYWVKNGEVWFTQPPVTCTTQLTDINLSLGTHTPADVITKSGGVQVTCDSPNAALNLSILAAGNYEESGWMRQTDSQGRSTKLTIDCAGTYTTKCSHSPIYSSWTFPIYAQSVPGSATGEYRHSYVITVTMP